MTPYRHDGIRLCALLRRGHVVPMPSTSRVMEPARLGGIRKSLHISQHILLALFEQAHIPANSALLTLSPCRMLAIRACSVDCSTTVNTAMTVMTSPSPGEIPGHLPKHLGVFDFPNLFGHVFCIAASFGHLSVSACVGLELSVRSLRHGCEYSEVCINLSWMPTTLKVLYLVQ